MRDGGAARDAHGGVNGPANKNKNYVAHESLVPRQLWQSLAVCMPHAQFRAPGVHNRRRVAHVAHFHDRLLAQERFVPGRRIRQDEGVRESELHHAQAIGRGVGQYRRAGFLLPQLCAVDLCCDRCCCRALSVSLYFDFPIFLSLSLSLPPSLLP